MPKGFACNAVLQYRMPKALRHLANRVGPTFTLAVHEHEFGIWIGGAKPFSTSAERSKHLSVQANSFLRFAVVKQVRCVKPHRHYPSDNLYACAWRASPRFSESLYQQSRLQTSSRVLILISNAMVTTLSSHHLAIVSTLKSKKT